MPLAKSNLVLMGLGSIFSNLNRYVLACTLIVTGVAFYKWLDSKKKWKEKYHAKIWFSGMGESVDQLFSQRKRELLQQCRLEGDVVEIGPADGYNLKYFAEFGDKITSLTCIEPNKEFLDKLKSKVDQLPFAVNLFNGTIEEFVATRARDQAVGEFDVILSIFLLCCVDSPVQTVTDCQALLREGGRLAVLEHNLDRHSYFIRVMQTLCNPFWRLIRNDCNMNRDTYSILTEAQWRKTDLTLFRIQTPLRSLIREFCIGVATK